MNKTEQKGSKKIVYEAVTQKPDEALQTDSKTQTDQIPINDVGILSYIFLSWLTPLVMQMYKHGDENMDETDIWQCSDLEKCKVNTDRLEEIWDEEIKKNGKENASFMRCWWKFCYGRFLSSLLGVIVNAVATFLVSGLLLKEIVSYIETSDGNMILGIGLVISMLVANIVRAGSFCFIMVFGAQTGARFRAGFLGIAYRKLLKLKKVKGKGLSEMITIFGGDAYRVYFNCLLFEYLLALPVYLIIAIAYLYYLIGTWSFLAIAVFVVGYLIQLLLAKCGQFSRENQLLFTDARVRKITEVLNSIKFIKMYAWENSFNDAILQIRRHERNFLLLSATISSIGSAIIPVLPTFASIVSIAVYQATGHDISASTAFAVVGTLHFFRIIVIFTPMCFRMLSEVQVSFDRMKNLLLEEEFLPHNCKCKDKENAVEISDGFFQWDAPPDDSTVEGYIIEGLNLVIQKEKLTAICGPVGSGRSSVLSAILGRMPMISGNVAIDGSIAYSSQQAWIFNDTLKENILFGKPSDENKFKEVVNVCGLESDISNMDNGENTEIGDRGINLSGGQKQRVSLARAVYSDSDIYLLDDPLSAVDVHVGKHLFNECIKKKLCGKTIILVTHQLQYLQFCDEIVVIENGKITERGHHEELNQIGDGYYKSMIEKYHRLEQNEITSPDDITMEDSNKDELTVDSEEKEDEKDKQTTKSDYNKTNNKEKGKLTEKEDLEKGTVKFSTYTGYMSAAGGVLISIVVLILFAASTGSVVFSDWWLSIWINSLSKETLLESTNLTTSKTLLVTTPITYNSTTGSSDNTRQSDVYFLVYVCTIGGIIFLTIIRGFIGAAVTIQASVQLHKRALRAVLLAPMHFFDANPTGRILNRFSKDADEVDVFLPQRIDGILQTLSTVIISLVSAAVVIPWILIGVVPVLIAFAVLKNIFNASTRQMKRLSNVANSPLFAYLNTTTQGLSTIEAYQERNSFTEKSEKLIDVTTTTTLLYDTCMRCIGLWLDLITSIIVVVTAAVLVSTKGTVNPALAALALTLCLKVVGLMRETVRMMNEVEAKFTSVERLNHYIENIDVEPSSFQCNPNDQWPNKGDIKFSDVEMTYRESLAPVLKNISFDIQPQQKVGVVGRTGAGKSSLITALYRLVELRNGHINIDGINISLIPLNVLRSRLSTIPQDPVMFSGTLRYNLDPFDSYTDDDLWSSLEKAHIKKKILQLDKGLQLLIEENGDNFSVGERQLICLARAILRKRKILILDEATASVDTDTDSLIQKTIKEAFSNCTVLTIAHRLKTVMNSDLLIIMENGNIIETGKPEDLLAVSSSHLNGMLTAETSISNA
ncbi:ATP-binding cassette sub-family C member 5-like isoform X1 [Mytilus edulis]|uniref:ATP-binding cassette sub-family C member 5-like isoform X1 n=1 Tax=Mytilus edulis TaxID=6550 RepID=UPI0039EFC10C